MRIAFMGTPDFAVPALEALIDSPHEVVAVYTQPPRPKGRGQKVQPSPVHLVAQAHNIPAYIPKSLKKDEAAQVEFAALDFDVAVVAAYGLILPKAVLEAPRFGCLNIHASLLPRWRGASLIQHAILSGDDESGVCIMQMEEGLDTGPVIDQRAVKIRPQTTAQRLHDELAALGAALIPQVIDRIAAANARLLAAAQDNAQATYAPLLTKEDGRIDWAQDAVAIDRKIRALNPWPGVWTTTQDGKRLKILTAEPVHALTAPPGTVIDHLGHIACSGDTGLRLLSVQPENAKAMDAVSALNGGYLAVDTILN